MTDSNMEVRSKIKQALSRFRSNLKGGWITLIGYTSGFLIFLYYFPQICIITYVWGNECINTGHVTPFPLKSDDIIHLVYLIFGFGAHSLFNKKEGS